MAKLEQARRFCLGLLGFGGLVAVEQRQLGFQVKKVQFFDNRSANDFVPNFNLGVWFKAHNKLVFPGIQIDVRLGTQGLNDFGLGPNAAVCTFAAMFDVFGAQAGQNFLADVTAQLFCRFCANARTQAAFIDNNLAVFFNYFAETMFIGGEPINAATKRLHGVLYNSIGLPICWMWPSFITTILSPIVIASIWSWVT